MRICERYGLALLTGGERIWTEVDPENIAVRIDHLLKSVTGLRESIFLRVGSDAVQLFVD